MNSVTDNELATRRRRVAAILLDVLMVPVIALMLAIVFGLFEHAEDYVGLRPFFSALAAGAAAYLVVNGWLMRSGQTLGKKLFKIVVSDLSGKPVGFLVMFARGLFFPLLYLIVAPPLTILPLLDVGVGVRKDRRCVHDLVCRTEVRCVS